MAPDDYGPAVLASMWGMFLLTSVIVGLRVYTRVNYSKFGYDDWITLVCWLVFLATAIPITVVVTWGFGKHIGAIAPGEQTRARKGQVIGTACVVLSFASPKFGIMATVQRATNPPSGFWQRVFHANWALCTASFVFLVAISVFQFTQCDPVAYQWELRGDGHCVDASVTIRLAYASSAFSTVLDLYFSILPALIIWKLQMSQRDRLTMSVMLGGANFATVASVVKMWKLGDAIAQIAEDPTCKYNAMCEIYILVYVETTLLIIGSSIAAIFPLFRHFSVRLRSSISGNNNGGSGSGGITFGTPLRTFGQGTVKRRGKDGQRGLVEDDETILTRGDGAVEDDATGSARSLEEGVVKSYSVEEHSSWAPADCMGPTTAPKRLVLTKEASAVQYPGR